MPSNPPRLFIAPLCKPSVQKGNSSLAKPYHNTPRAPLRWYYTDTDTPSLSPTTRKVRDSINTSSTPAPPLWRCLQRYRAPQNTNTEQRRRIVLPVFSFLFHPPYPPPLHFSPPVSSCDPRRIPQTRRLKVRYRNAFVRCLLQYG